VAISQDEQRVVAYAAEVRDALSIAKELGEEHPIIFRVPPSPVSFVL
jgi:thiamine monophosphate kinase